MDYQLTKTLEYQAHCQKLFDKLPFNFRECTYKHFTSDLVDWTSLSGKIIDLDANTRITILCQEDETSDIDHLGEFVAEKTAYKREGMFLRSIYVHDYPYFRPRVSKKEHIQDAIRLGDTPFEAEQWALMNIREDMHRLEAFYEGKWTMIWMTVIYEQHGVQLAREDAWGIESDTDCGLVAETLYDLITAVTEQSVEVKKKLCSREYTECNQD